MRGSFLIFAVALIVTVHGSEVLKTPMDYVLAKKRATPFQKYSSYLT
jgi:hypothetical protein